MPRELFRRDQRGFPALDGVRAVAVLMIVVFHASAYVVMYSQEAALIPPGIVRKFLRELWIGVDVFFVLSGFLIGRILLLQLENGPIDFKGFYIRRAARIFPAYYLVLTLGVFVFSRFPAFEFIYDHLTLGEVVQRSVKNYTYLANYLRDPNAPDAMGWAWSLCVEEHFYLFLPLTLTLLWRFTPAVRLSALVALWSAPMLFRFVAYLRNPATLLWDWPQWESHTHSDGLLLGVVIAYLQLHHRAQLTRLTKRFEIPMLVVAFVCFASVFRSGGLFRPGIYPLVLQLFLVSLGTALLVTICVCLDDVLSRVLAHRAWYPIARVSYGMYLIHPFVILAMIAMRPGIPRSAMHSLPKLVAFLAGASFATFVIASVMFLAVELPAQRWGIRRSQATRRA